ncbi:hypothetical protein Tco_0488536 [Tanacetum coccineum]
MSDSDESGVTYMEISSTFEELSDIGSPGVVPSPDYIPGPEEPQSPPPLDYVPKPIYPEYMPQEDEVFLAEEQPLPAAASPTGQSPDYVSESDPEADLEEDDDEDLEEDPVDYPVDGGDDDDDEEGSSEDDEDDDMDIEADDDDEEEEHPAPADSVVVALPAMDQAPSTKKTEPAQVPTPVWSDAEVARLLAIFTLPSSLVSPWSSPLPQIPSPPLLPIPSPSLPVSPPLLLGLKRLHGFLKVIAAQVRNRSRFGINKWYQSFALRNFDLEDMELESTNSGPTAKLPILKLGEYEMWAIRIKQYFQIQDYALWEVIENGDSWVSISQTTKENGITTSKMSTPATAEEKTKKKNDVKARGLLLMALPNEHQLTFSQYPDAKSMFAAIKTRFRGNVATKKTLLKEQYKNFNATSAESLDFIFNRLQKIVIRLAILGVIIAQEVLNLKFLSSLPPEWNTHVVVWMNKPEIETMSIDDLYNNFKIIEQKIKKTISTSSGGQNLAFMTALNSSICTASVSDNTVYAFLVDNPNGSNVLHQDLEQIHEDDLEAIDLKWQLSLLSVRAKKYYQKTGKKIFINGNDIVGYDKSKSDMAEEQVQTNMALMAFSDSEVYTDKTCSKTCLNNYETLKKQYDDLLSKQLQTKFEASTYKRGLDTVEVQLVTYRKNEVLFSEEVVILKREVEIKQYEINMLKTKFEKITDKSKKGLGYSAVPPPHPLIYNRPNKLDLSYSGLDEFKEPEFKGYGPENNQESQVKSSFVECSESNTSKNVSEVEPKKVRKNNDAPIIEDWVSDDGMKQDES